MANKLSRLRELYGDKDYARSYQYLFTFATIPGLLRPILPNLDMLKVGCLRVNIPEERSEIIEVPFGSQTMKLNGKTSGGGILNPEFLMDGDYSIYHFFRSWKALASPMYYLNAGARDNQITNNSLLATIIIQVLRPDNQVAFSSIYEFCWCSAAPEIEFSDETNGVIRWAPEISYDQHRNLPGEVTSLTQSRIVGS